MRFYCPKCDLKYRIEDDTLVERSNAQMRCKACGAVFSVQSALKTGRERTGDERAPIDGAGNLSMPPPKPVPMLWRSAVPAASTPPGKGVVTMPLLDVTAKPRLDLAKQVKPTPTVVTKPGLAPYERGLLVGPKAGQRGRGASSLLTAKSLRVTQERDNPPQAKPKGERALETGSTRPVRVVGRGSALGFPPVTEERTHPAVPLLPRAAKLANLSALASTVEESPAAGDLGEPAEDTEFEVVESMVPPPLETSENTDTVEITPIEFTQPVAPSEVEHGIDDDADGVDAAATPRSLPIGALVDSSVPRHTTETNVQGQSLDARLNETHGAAPAGPQVSPSELEPFITPKGQGRVSFAAVVCIALVCGAAGFGVGYTTATRTARVAAPGLLLVNETARMAVAAPPPPPPSEQEGMPGENPEAVLDTTTPVSGAVRSVRAAHSQQEVVEKSPDVKDANALQALANPVAGPGVDAQESNPGLKSGLDAALIQATVQKSQPLIRRSCWQSALSRHGSEGAATARVVVTVTITPAGRVASAEHHGDPFGFPGLGACIATRVKSWKFPRAATGTTVNIPFVFAAQ